MELDVQAVNQQLRDKTPKDIIEWAVALGSEDVICSTNFRPYEPVILHQVVQVKPDMTILWADSGCFLEETYRFAQEVTNRLSLNLRVYNPLMTEARRKALFGAIPGISQPEELALFTQQVKIEPFKRGLAELKPKVWITAIRKEQTEHRAAMDIVTLGNDGIVKVAPLFNWSEEQLEVYTQEHALPNEKVYFDPTKIDEKRECGLHVENA